MELSCSTSTSVQETDCYRVWEGKPRTGGNGVGKVRPSSAPSFGKTHGRRGCWIVLLGKVHLHYCSFCCVPAFTWWFPQPDPTCELKELESSCINCWCCGKETAVDRRMETRLVPFVTHTPPHLNLYLAWTVSCGLQFCVGLCAH